MRFLQPKHGVRLGLMAMLCTILISMSASASELSVISVDQFSQIQDNPAIMIIDVRQGRDWRSSNMKIKGAVRRAPENFKAWANQLPKDKQLVLYCA